MNRNNNALSTHTTTLKKAEPNQPAKQQSKEESTGNRKKEYKETNTKNGNRFESKTGYHQRLSTSKTIRLINEEWLIMDAGLDSSESSSSIPTFSPPEPPFPLTLDLDSSIRLSELDFDEDSLGLILEARIQTDSTSQMSHRRARLDNSTDSSPSSSFSPRRCACRYSCCARYWSWCCFSPSSSRTTFLLLAHK